MHKVICEGSDGTRVFKKAGSRKEAIRFLNQWVRDYLKITPNNPIVEQYPESVVLSIGFQKIYTFTIEAVPRKGVKMPKKAPESPTRSQMVEFIAEDMRDWLRRDESGFWEHVQDLERAYLREKDDKELKQIYEETI